MLLNTGLQGTFRSNAIGTRAVQRVVHARQVGRLECTIIPGGRFTVRERYDSALRRIGNEGSLGIFQARAQFCELLLEKSACIVGGGKPPLHRSRYEFADPSRSDSPRQFRRRAREGHIGKARPDNRFDGNKFKEEQRSPLHGEPLVAGPDFPIVRDIERVDESLVGRQVQLTRDAFGQGLAFEKRVLCAIELVVIESIPRRLDALDVRYVRFDPVDLDTRGRGILRRCEQRQHQRYGDRGDYDRTDYQSVRPENPPDVVEDRWFLRPIAGAFKLGRLIRSR